MANVQHFRDLVAYQRSRSLAGEVYRFSASFPKDDRFELTSQVRRAANSIALNIAEGFGIGTTQDTLRHLRIARGSLCEVGAALDLAGDYGFGAPPQSLAELHAETERVLQGLIRSMEAHVLATHAR